MSPADDALYNDILNILRSHDPNADLDFLKMETDEILAVVQEHGPNLAIGNALEIARSAAQWSSGLAVQLSPR